MGIKEEIKMMYVSALLNLCKKKPLKKITINDLLAYTNTARQTFYNHFKDKNELIGYVYTFNSDKIRKSNANEVPWNTCIKYIMDFCLEYKNFFIESSKLGTQNNMADYFFEDAVIYYMNYVIDNFGQKALTEPVKSSIIFNCYGAQGVFFSWIKKGMLEPTADVAKSIFECMPEDLKKFYDNP